MNTCNGKKNQRLECRNTNKVKIHFIFAQSERMAIETNGIELVTYGGNSTQYFFSPKHRGNPTDEISVWIIDHAQELAVFTTCFAQSWIDLFSGWGILQPFQVLGENLRNNKLIIAKFVVDQNQWHGYPADVRYKPKDKPNPRILKSWYDDGLINKSTLSRIKQGQI